MNQDGIEYSAKECSATKEAAVNEAKRNRELLISSWGPSAPMNTNYFHCWMWGEGYLLKTFPCLSTPEKQNTK